MSIAQQPPARPQKFRPPMISLLYAGGWSLAAQELYGMGLQGTEWGSFASCVAGGLAIGQLVRASNDWAMIRALRRKTKRFRLTAKRYGQARFATKRDIAKSEIFTRDRGIFLGTFPTGKRTSRDLFYDGEASLSVIAPAGESKTMSIVVPTLLANPGQNLIINDPSGECYSICQPALKKAGYECIVITPFPKEVSQLIGQEVTDAGIDVFSSLTPDMDPSTVRIRLEAILKWVLPGKANMDEKSAFFYRSARMICSFLAMKELIEGRKPTLAAIRKHLMNGPANIQELFAEAEGSPAFGGVYAELADSLQGVLTAASQQFAGGYGIAEQALDCFDHFSSMGKHVSQSTFDPRSLKDPEQKIAVFIIYTIDKMETYAASIAMTLTYLFDTIASDNQSGRVTAVIDECGSLNMPKLANSLNFYRKAGLRCLMIWQDLAGQAEKTYGKATMQQIMAGSKIKICMGLQEPQTLEMFSKLCGTRSATGMTLNDRSLATDSVPELNDGLNHHSVPLMRPEEIRTMSSDEILVVAGNVPAMKLKKLRYWERASWRKIAGPSPFHRE